MQQAPSCTKKKRKRKKWMTKLIKECATSETNTRNTQKRIFYIWKIKQSDGEEKEDEKYETKKFLIKCIAKHLHTLTAATWKSKAAAAATSTATACATAAAAETTATKSGDTSTAERSKATQRDNGAHCAATSIVGSAHCSGNGCRCCCCCCYWRRKQWSWQGDGHPQDGQVEWLPWRQ